jgi:CheY-like chemotaxis protein
MALVRVHSFPSVDGEFARAIHRWLASVRTAGTPPDPGELETALRASYPRAQVSVQQELASNDSPADPLWYAFRDGALAARRDEPRRVLVVDDDEAFSEMLEAMLVGWGCEVRRAPDGHAGLHVATDFNPNLILLDLAMPNASGEEFATRYRSGPLPRAPIVVISGLPDAWKRAQTTDARAILPKPFEMDVLRSIVTHLI